jgi:hypothetical protein
LGEVYGLDIDVHLGLFITVCVGVAGVAASCLRLGLGQAAPLLCRLSGAEIRQIFDNSQQLGNLDSRDWQAAGELAGDWFKNCSPTAVAPEFGCSIGEIIPEFLRPKADRDRQTNKFNALLNEGLKLKKIYHTTSLETDAKQIRREIRGISSYRTYLQPRDI